MRVRVGRGGAGGGALTRNGGDHRRGGAHLRAWGMEE